MNERIGAQVKLRQRPGGFWRKRGRRRCIFDLLFVEQSQQHQQRQEQQGQMMYAVYQL